MGELEDIRRFNKITKLLQCYDECDKATHRDVCREICLSRKGIEIEELEEW